MSERSRGRRKRIERKWRAEREAKRQVRLAALKTAVLAPLGPKKLDFVPPEIAKSPEEL